MKHSRSWFLAFGLISCSFSILTGQHCPSIPEALNQLYGAEDNGAALIRLIKEQCPGANDSLSQVLHKRSVYAYSSENDLETAIDFARQALVVQRELYADKPAIPLGKSLANLGLFYRLNGQYSLALPYLQEANKVYAELQNYYRRQNNHQQMVKLWQSTGDLGQSAALLDVMLAEARLAQSREADRSTGLVAEAETLRLQGEQANQARKYTKGLPAFAQASVLFSDLGDLASLLMTYMGQGRAYFHLERYDESREVTLKALSLAKDYELNYDKAVMYNLLALNYQEEGRPATGIDNLETGMAFATAYGGAEVLGTYANTRASLVASQGDLTAALNENASAIGHLIQDWESTEETLVPAPDQVANCEYKQLLFEFLVQRANLLYDDDQPERALEVVRAADQLADILRLGVGGQVSKLFWRQEALPLYEFGVRLSQQLQDAERVFYFLERSRSILLLEALLQEDVRELIGPDLARQLAQAEHKITQQQKALVSASPEEVTELKRRLLAAEADIMALREQIAHQFPGTRQRLLMPELVSVNKARQQLKSGGWDRQVHFLFGEERVYAFSLTEEEARTYDLGPATKLDSMVRSLLAFYTSPRAIEQQVTTYLDLSHQVYQALFSQLNLAEGERLLLLPDGLLAYLPIAALVTEPRAQDISAAPYMIKRNPLSYAQSATILGRQMGEDRIVARGEAFAFAPFVEALPNQEVSALPFTKDEVEGIAQYYREEVVSGRAATKDTLLIKAPDFKILHLSTHAFAAAADTVSAQILTGTDPVYLADLFGLHLSAELVTLSACQSNIGPLAQGEGVLGFGRAFTAAGAGGVVASLWSLNDRSTMEVLTSFYDKLAAGTTKPMALHEAQLAYLNRTDIPGYLKSPYYWAGLTYYGNAGTLPARRFPVWVWGVLIASLLLSLYVLSRILLRAKAKSAA